MWSVSIIWLLIGAALTADSLLRLALLLLRTVLRKPSPQQDDSIFLNEANEANERGCVVLIAAHNEVGTIGPTVIALKGQLHEWPGTRVWVVADRCSDQTAEEARRAGAHIAHRTEGQLGKCAVIAWWLKEHEAEWRDCGALIVLDADSRLQPGSFTALRRAMAAPGVAAAQSFVAPDATTNAGRLAGWSEVLMQRMDDEARRRCGWSVPLRGTGMAFRPVVLAELAPRLHTLAEDLELDVLLAASGRRVAFVPEAIVLDPKPAKPAGASRQRARWLQGQFQVLRAYPHEMLQALREGGAGAWFLLVLLMLRPKIFFLGLRFVALVVSFWVLPLRGIAGMGLVMDGVYFLAGAAFVDNGRRYLLDLLAVPRYAAMWLASFALAAFQRLLRRRAWLRAGRENLNSRY